MISASAGVGRGGGRFPAKRGWIQQALIPSILMAGALCALLALASSFGWLAEGEHLGYDLLIRLRGAEPAASDLVLVDFDDASVREMQAFPLPRRLLATVLRRIAEGNPSVVGLDVILDFSRSQWGDDDEALAAAIREAGNVVIVTYLALDGGAPGPPLPLFSEAEPVALAFCDMPEDSDGYVRRMFLLAAEDTDGDGTSDKNTPSFPVAVASVFSGMSLQPGRPDAHRFGAFDVPLVTRDPDTTLIHFADSPPASLITVRELLAPRFDPSILRGKIVLVGQTSSYGRDVKNTPVFRFEQSSKGWRLLSGAEVQAAAIQTLLRGGTIRPAPSIPFWTALWVSLAILIGLLVSLRPVPGVLLALAVAAAFFVVSAALFLSQSLWVPYVTAEAGMALALPLGLGYRFVKERRLKTAAEAERRQIMGIFGKYVSPEVAEEIWNRREEIVLAGEERTATVLFSDIRSFTALTAGKPSAEVLAWLNRYLTEMSAIVKENRGFINKFIGDGIMVLFGVPLSEGIQEDAGRAVRTSLQMLEGVERLNKNRPPEQPELKIGIGIHTGVLTAGNVGAPDRLEYSVIGETVNLASRLETLTKSFGRPIVMSAATRELVQGRFLTIPLGGSEVRGFEGSLALFSAQDNPASEKQS